MPTIRVSDEVIAMIAYQANKDSTTVKEAAEKLINQGYERFRSLEKWRKKEKARRAKAQRSASKVAA